MKRGKFVPPVWGQGREVINIYNDPTIKKMESDDDDCGPICCLGSMGFGCVFFLCATLSLSVGDVIITIFAMAVLGIVGIWMIYCCYNCCYDICENRCWSDLRDSIPVITITIRRPAPDTHPVIINSYKMKRTDVVCTICMEEIKKNSVCKKIPKCGHEFHKKCIDKWLIESKTCPNCRLDV